VGVQIKGWFGEAGVLLNFDHVLIKHTCIEPDWSQSSQLYIQSFFSLF